MYEKLFEDINMHKADIACCNYFKENKPTLAHNVYGPTVKISNEDAMKYLLQGKIICGFIWNKVYSRNLLQDSRFDEDIFITQDVVFNVKIFNRAKIITYNEKQMYHYLYRAESASHGKFRVKKLTEISARERVLSIIKKSYPGLEEIAFSRYIETILRIGVSLAVSKTANRVLFEENQKLVINNKDRIFNSKVISRRFKRHAYFQLHSYAFCRKVYAVTTQGRRLNYFLLEKANTFLKTVGLN